jgi:hypothetical protein
MITIETLAVAAPILVAVAFGLFGLATNYFDDKATAKTCGRPRCRFRCDSRKSV